jgi:hypothetical protein
LLAMAGGLFGGGFALFNWQKLRKRLRFRR